MFVHIHVALLISTFVSGEIFWTLREKTVVFGTTVHLVCTIPPQTPCCDSNRKWMKSTGGTFILVAMNGASTNKTKYIENLLEGSRESVLAINNFNENDVNADYECWYEFDKYRGYLGLNEQKFEYHPTAVLPVTPNVTDDLLQFAITFHKVYPRPICSAYIGNKNITSFLTVETAQSGLLYKSTLSINYTTTYPKKDVMKLDVKCTIGKTVLEVVRPPKNQSQGSSAGIIAVIICVCVVLIGVIVLIVRFKGYPCSKKDRTDNQGEFHVISDPEQSV